MQADAEHQQDHADLGELACQRLISNEDGRRRADQHPGDKVTDQRRQAKTVSERAKQPGSASAMTMVEMSGL